jgi:hypothetical protein
MSPRMIKGVECRGLLCPDYAKHSGTEYIEYDLKDEKARSLVLP